MFKNMSLKAKLMTSFGAVALVLAIVGAVGFYGLSQTIYYYSHVSENNLVNSIALGKMQAAQKDVVVSVIGLVGSNNTVADVDAQVALISESTQRFAEARNIAESVPHAPEEVAVWKEFDAHWEAFGEMSFKLLELSKSTAPADLEKRVKLAATDYEALKLQFKKELQTLSDFEDAEAKTWTGHAQTAAKTAKYIIITTVALGFIFAFAIGYFMARSLSSKLNAISADLSSEADQVANVTVQVSTSSEQLSSSATQQATALQQTAASIEEMSSMISKSADNAKKSQSVAEASEVMASKGKEAIVEMIQAIDQISANNADIMKQTEVGNRQISEIVKVIAEIGNKTKVINDIVFQTKLLSFNASVEAARAGEHGRGFAVVAEEVGNLAQMSGNAAKEISALLEGSIEKVEFIVIDTKTKIEKLVQVGKEKVDLGSSVAKNCNEVLEQIVSGVSDVSRMSIEISTASEEQANGVQEIAKAMSQLDQVTQQNAASSHQVSGAAVKLSSQATNLRAMVMGLVQTVKGGELQEFKETSEDSSDAEVVSIETTPHSKAG